MIKSQSLTGDKHYQLFTQESVYTDTAPDL